MDEVFLPRSLFIPDDHRTKALAKFFRYCLGEKTRLDILKLLLCKKEMRPSDIAQKLGVSVPNLSYHLREMADEKNGGFLISVTSDRDGRERIYHIRSELIPLINTALSF